MLTMAYMNERATRLNAYWESECDKKIRNTLQQNGVITLWDLVACTRNNLIKMPGVGSTSVNQIERLLEGLGLALRKEAKIDHVY